MSTLDGVVVTHLKPRSDERGVLTEVFRNSWPHHMSAVQWNAVSTHANVMRGFHVHVAHTDYLLCLSGDLLLGLRDIRPGSPTFGRTEKLLLGQDQPMGVTVPPGVAHGFYFARPSMHLYAVSHYWDTADELGCRWNDPDIGIDWPVTSPLLSPRDQDAGSFAQMVDAFVQGRARPRDRAEPRVS